MQRGGIDNISPYGSDAVAAAFTGWTPHQSQPRNKTLIIIDISVLEFYGYIKNIGKISMDILTKISVKKKLTKIL